MLCLYCVNVGILGGCDARPRIYGMDEPQSVCPLEKAESAHTVSYPLELLGNLHVSQGKSLTKNFWSITYRQMEREQNELLNKRAPRILFTTSCLARTPQSLSWIETFNSTQIIFPSSESWNQSGIITIQLNKLRILSSSPLPFAKLNLFVIL